MNKNNVIELEGRAISADPLTELLRSGARQLLAQAVEGEVQELLAQHRDRRTQSGHAGVVRNGHLPERELQTGLGPVPVKIPKVRAKSGAPVTFQSALVPPYIRKTRSLEAALPWLYLKGVSSGEMAAALKVLVGPQAQGLELLSNLVFGRLIQAAAWSMSVTSIPSLNFTPVITLAR